MANVSSSIRHELYKVEIESPSGNIVISDEPLDNGGKNLGLNPKELLTASLASCTSITLKMYAKHKGWDLQEVDMEVDLTWDDEQNTTVIHRKMQFIGNLDDSQKARLIAVANSCPVHKILSHPISLHSEITEF
ncbi:MAG: OsmC family protein [Cytophagales bacterium]|nr:OsmC family protein [Cytophagales bacterium]